MTAEIIAVGTELLLGETTNTDARFVAEKLSEMGISVYHHTVVGDNPERLRRVLEIACARADIIVSIGGLGPTVDDLTKETIASFFGKALYLDEASLSRIEAHFQKVGRTMTENNVKQAMLPEGCTVFANDWGTAPGCAFYARGRHVLMLPGPPSECEPMFAACGVRYLAALSGGVIASHYIRVFGMGESMVETKLHDMMRRMTNPTVAPYAKTGECLVRVTASAPDEESAERMLAPVVEEVRGVLGSVVYGVDVASLEEVVIKGLIARGLTLSVAESCTGGLLSKRITDVPGASACYEGGACTYSNRIKSDILGVDADVILKNGAVSREVAAQMAQRVAARFGTDVGVGITGIAGPGGGTDAKPVGLVYIAVWHDGTLYEFTQIEKTTRERVRTLAASNALNLIRTKILEKM